MIMDLSLLFYIMRWSMSLDRDYKKYSEIWNFTSDMWEANSLHHIMEYHLKVNMVFRAITVPSVCSFFNALFLPPPLFLSWHTLYPPA